MKIHLPGLLQLKPFDESADARIAGKIYASSPALAAGVVISGVLGVAALGLQLFGHESALPVLGLCIAVSAVTAGLEWHANLKARALNQLFATLIVTAVVSLIQPTI
ncbi:hypothetical protein [Azospira sp. I09]|uniref:hypothetical protein n=1 Tax=Azospira sp. I09 TaxID=1765049 RepID=UPI001260DAFA|nr:hypothetical protein [Azospira sp. I09]BBN90684.1 hypothetical protein AZSP09_37070 [Azospira sp. I09]